MSVAFRVCLLAIIYIATAVVGLQLASIQANTSPVWPPTGIAIAVLYRYGIRHWPGVFLGAAIVNFAIIDSALISASIAIGNTLEAVFAVHLMSIYLPSYPFSRIMDVISFVFILMAACSISALTGVGSLLGGGVVMPGEAALLISTWWLGDFVGGLIVAPLLLIWTQAGRMSWPLKVKPGEMVAFGIVSTLFIAVLAAGMMLPNNIDHRLNFLLLIPTLWCALRFGLPGATLFVFLVSIVAIIATLNGQGPFVSHTPNDALLHLQAFMGVTMVTALILATGAQENAMAHRAATAAQQSAERRVSERTQQLQLSNTQLELERNRLEELLGAMHGLLSVSTGEARDGYFHAAVKALAHTYKCQFSFVGVFDDEFKQTIKTLAVWAGSGVGDNFTYTLAGTPCQDVLDANAELISRDASLRYPGDKMLLDMGVESYYGAPLVLPSQETVGILAVMNTSPMDVDSWVKPVLHLFAHQVALELERRRAHQELELAASVFNEGVEAVLICDSTLKIIRINPAFTRITGYCPEDVIGKSPHILNSGHHAPDFFAAFWDSLNRTGVWQGEIWDRRKNGELFPAWQTITVVKNAQQKPVQYISIFSDITEKKISEHRLYQLAHYDLLTDLPNRAAFQHAAEQALHLAARNERRLALLFIDLDHFKWVNDTAGHPMGDELLKQSAARLKRTVRMVDMVARLGGDEFTVLLPEIESQNDIVNVAKKIIDAMKIPFFLKGANFTIGASIGIAVYPHDGESVESLLKNADIALYRAKEEGRGNFQFFTSEMNQQAIERVRIENELRQAIQNNELILHYQPQFCLRDNTLIGCEVLLRWQHPERGLLSALSFIAVAEHSDLIFFIGEWVLATACQQYMQWKAQGLANFRLAVNVSARQFKGALLIELIQRVMASSGILAKDLELEITESVLITRIEESIETLNTLRHMGINIAIDDFGTGYSSLAYLKRFPIDKLKIDRSFVEDISTDNEDNAIVDATIALGRSLGITTIAEGVETAQQQQWLRDHGCDEVQGYYFSKPLDNKAMEAFLVGINKKGQMYCALTP